MAIAPYNPGALGPSAAYAADQQAYNNIQQGQQNINNKALQQGYLTNQFQTQTMPSLQSTLSGNGQFYGSAGQKAQGNAQTDYKYQMHGIDSAFNQAQMDLQRQQVFSSIGLMI